MKHAPKKSPQKKSPPTGPTFRIRGDGGEVRNLTGDPSELTLRHAMLPVSGAKGGERAAVRYRVNGQEYGPAHSARTFAELGIQPDTEVELLEP